MLRLALVSLLICGCGLKGRRLPDGGYAGTPQGCNRTAKDGNRLPDPADERWRFVNVVALRLDEQGNVYVMSRGAAQTWISVFGPWPLHELKGGIGPGPVAQGVDFVREGDGSIWAIDFADEPAALPEVVHLSPQGQRLTAFTLTTDEAQGLALDRQGRIVVSVGRLARFERDGGVDLIFGAKAPRIPHYQGLELDSAGSLWATELTDRTVEQFDSTGQRAAAIGGHGPGPAMFDGNTDVHGGPSKLAFDSRGDLYVNDPLASRIMKLSRQGSMLGTFDFGGATNIDPMVFDPVANVLYVGRENGVDVICAF